MDYPKSVPGVGLVNGRFVDEDTASGTQGSLIPAAWGNAVTTELLTVIEASGQRPSEGDNTQLVNAIHRISARQAGHGQCRISVVSPSVLRLLPFNGNSLIINGVPQKIPIAGVSLSNAGLRADTGYYVYAHMRAEGMALECSPTGHIRDAQGVEVRLDRQDQTLVGWTRTSTSSTFAVDTGAAIWTMNWFNKRPISIVASSTADISFTNKVMSELSSTLRAVVPVWSGESCTSSINGIFFNGLTGGGVNIQLYSGGLPQGTRMSSNLGAELYCPFNTQTFIPARSDGLIDCQLYGFVGSGVGRVAVGVQLLITSWV